MGIVIDSNILIDLDRDLLNAQSFLTSINGNDEIFISVITVSELLHGVHRAKQPNQKIRRSAFVEKIIASIPALPVNLPIARTHAELSANLKKSGKMIGLHNSWIAATCIAHGYRLATSDLKAFRHVPGLSIITGFG